MLTLINRLIPLRDEKSMSRKWIERPLEYKTMTVASSRRRQIQVPNWTWPTDRLAFWLDQRSEDAKSLKKRAP